MQLSNILALLAQGIAIVISILAVRSEVAKVRDHGLIVGVVNCECPPELDGFADFTSYRKCLRSTAKKKVLYCRLLSFALKHCDFVICDEGCDVKIINPHDVRKLKAISE